MKIVLKNIQYNTFRAQLPMTQRLRVRVTLCPIKKKILRASLFGGIRFEEMWSWDKFKVIWKNISWYYKYHIEGGMNEKWGYGLSFF